MIYAVEPLCEALKSAREEKALSQRALGKSAGMPQAQISKIENAAVDMKTSTLIELARALDLEVMLVPRKHVPGVKAIIGASSALSGKNGPQRPAYALDAEDDHD